jgi:putative transposase
MRQNVLRASVPELWREFNAHQWEGDYRAAGRQAIKALLEERMENYIDRELAALRASGERGVDRRNGSYERHLGTELGDVALAVPRTRQESGAAVLALYRRRPAQVDRMIMGCFVHGLSTRKVAQALLPVLGEAISAPTVSRVARQLDEQVGAYHRRRLRDQYPVLLLDGVVLKQRTGVGAVKRCVLVALGFWPDGRKEVIDFYLAESESQAAWEAFLQSLYVRGLEGQALRLIATDGGSGLLAALPLVWPHVPVQRCWAHKSRNILDKVKRADQPAVKLGLPLIYDAPNRRRAVAAAQEWMEQWRERYPEAVKCLQKDLDELLTCYRFPAAWRRSIRTTNAIERRFREVRRRTRVMGTCADRTSMERILYAVFAFENKKQKVNPILLLTQNP